MLNPQESVIKLKGYFKKLTKTINEEASFTFGGTKLVNKQRIDDLLCCIEGTFPKEYKRYIKEGVGKKLASDKNYSQLMFAIKNKFLFSSSTYAVKYGEANTLINGIISSLEKDINFVFSEESRMF